MVQPPLSPFPTLDDGRSLMPMLQDIVLQYYYKVQNYDGPGWDDYLARRLSQYAVNSGLVEYTGPPPFNSASNVGETAKVRCSGAYSTDFADLSGQLDLPLVDLVAPLKASLVDYQAAFRETFWDPEENAWKTFPKGGASSWIVGQVEPVAALDLGSAAMREVARMPLLTQEQKEQLEKDAAARLPVVGPSVLASAAGWGSYYLASRFLFGV